MSKYIDIDGLSTFLANIREEYSLGSIMGSSAIGSTSAYPYWTGSSWATQSLSDYALKSAIPTSLSDLANDVGYITASAIPTSYAWSAITGKPTTLSGYGITDAAYGGGGDGYTSISFKGSYIVHYGDTSDWRLTSKGWQTEYKILHSDNIGSYAPIYNSAGNVLIGTTTDNGAKLYVKDTRTDRTGANLIIDGSGTAYGFGYMGIGLCHNGEGKGGFGWNSVPLSYGANNTAGIFIANDISGDHINLYNEGGIYAYTSSFQTNGNIIAGGNVLIGTTTDSGYRFDSMGKGRFQSGDPGILSLKRIVNGGGAFIDYYADNQDTNYWRAGGAYGYSFDWEFNTATKMSLSNTGDLTLSKSVKVNNIEYLNLRGFKSSNSESVFGFHDNSPIILSHNGVIRFGITDYNSNVWYQFNWDYSTKNLTIKPSEGANMTTNFTGNITASGEITALGSSSSSDRRLKDIVSRPTPLTLEDIAKLNVISFKWNHRENDKRLKIGLVAQEVQEILPELVGVDRSNYLTLDYSTFGSVVGVMNTKKILSLEERVEALENENKELRRKIYG